MSTMQFMHGRSCFSYIPGESDPVSVQRTSEVMKAVFNHLQFRDLCHSRLVCRSWNDIVCAGNKFWDLSVMVLRGNPDQTLDFLRGREFKYWKNFRFITPLLDNSSQIQASFWLPIGYSIQSLELMSHSLSSVEFLAVLSACPNLRSLTFSCRNMYDCQLWKTEEGSIQHQKMTHVIRLVDNVRCLRQQNFLSELTSLKVLDSNLLPQGVLRDLLLLVPKVEALCLHDTSMVTVPLWDVADVLRYVALNPKLVTRLELTGSNLFPEYVGALANVGQLKLSSLHLRHAKLTDNCLLALFKQQKNLTEVDLSFTQISQRTFLHLQCSFTKLKRLILRGFSSNITSFAFLARMVNLEELDISATFSTTMNWELLIDSLLPLKLKKLKSLNLCFNTGLGIFPRAKLFTSLMSTLCHLTCLNLSQNTFVKDPFVHDIWRHLPHLRVVFLEYLIGMSTEGITGIRHSQMQNLLANGTLDKIDPSLLRLHNSGGSYIGVCPRIEILSLAYNPRLNDFVIPFGVTDLENLQKLKLTGCSQITPQYFVDLITYCTRLEYLDMSGTQISGEWADWAKRANPKLRQVIYSYLPAQPPPQQMSQPCIPDGSYVNLKQSALDISCKSVAAPLPDQEEDGEPAVKVLLGKQFDGSEIEEEHKPRSRGDFPPTNLARRSSVQLTKDRQQL